METSIRVYCAGKVQGTKWRDELFGNVSDRWDYSIPPPAERPQPNRMIAKGRFHYIGPWTCNTDHCPTPVGEHGLAGGMAGDVPALIYRNNVLSRSLKAIRDADCVFVWLDDSSAYGSLVEVGYAKDRSVFTGVYFATKEMREEMWFAASCACYSGVAGSAGEAWNDFTRYAADFYGNWLRDMPYAQYLQTRHWDELREAAKANAGNRCQLCNTESGLQVHHRTYERRGREELSDLTVLCGGCHSKHHDKVARSGHQGRARREDGPISYGQLMARYGVRR
jgi:hypothetical protein